MSSLMPLKNILQYKNDNNILKIKKHYSDSDTVDIISDVFAEALLKHNRNFKKPIVILGVGTDRSTGDSLGPLVGEMLLAQDITCSCQLTVLGTLDEPVHATNLNDKLQMIHSQFQNPLIIGIDACLGRSSSVGHITLSEGPLKPGSGVKKKLPEVGQLNFTGTVNIGGYMEYIVLQNTRLNIVMKMARVISECIVRGINKAEKSSQSLTW